MQTTCIEQELGFDLLSSQFGFGKSKYKWDYVDQGSYRAAFRGEDKKVYKVPLEIYDEYIGENEIEFNNYLRIKELPNFAWHGNSWKVPEMQIFKFPSFGEFEGSDGIYNLSVIVMPYIKGKPFDQCMDKCGAKSIIDCLEYDRANIYYGMFDLGYENVLILSDGTRVPIDLQC